MIQLGNRKYYLSNSHDTPNLTDSQSLKPVPVLVSVCVSHSGSKY